jgi:nitrate reductase gamma subunit
LLLIGCGYVLLRLIAVKEFRRNRSVGDLLFFLSLFIVTVTGFTTQYYRLSGDPVMALSNYITHLAANVILLGAAPFTHFFHAISTPFLRIFTVSLKYEELNQIKMKEILRSVENILKKS